MTFIHVLTFLKDKKENKVGLGGKRKKLKIILKYKKLFCPTHLANIKAALLVTENKCKIKPPGECRSKQCSV